LFLHLPYRKQTTVETTTVAAAEAITSLHLDLATRLVLCNFGTLASETQYENLVEDVHSGYGRKTCFDIDTAVHIDKTIDADHCPAVTKAAQEVGCCTRQCDLCSIGQWIRKENRYLTVNAPLAGFENASRDTLFRAAYWYGTIDMENCPLVCQAAKDAGCCAPYGFFTCGAGVTSPRVRKGPMKQCPTRLALPLSNWLKMKTAALPFAPTIPVTFWLSDVLPRQLGVQN
jgi:hypothetical protein